MKGIMITRQGLRVYRDALDRRVDPRGRPYYWIGGEAPTGVNEEGTDVGALFAGYVSITPLQLDLTNYKAMDVLKNWEWKDDRAWMHVRRRREGSWTLQNLHRSK